VKRVALLLTLVACGGGGGGGIDGGRPDAAIDIDAVGGWGAPSCTSVTGAAITFTRDEGATLAGTEPLTGTFYTMGLVALAEPGHLLAGTASAIFASSDAGCTWTHLDDTGSSMRLAARGDVAYGYADNQALMVRIEGGVVTPVTPPSAVVGLAVDPADVDHLRIVDDHGQIQDSVDGGVKWTRLGTAATDGSQITYRGAFDPTDLDHVMVGASVGGASVTTTAGTTWTPSTGLATGNANVFNLAIAPSPAIVWAEGLDLSQTDGMNRHVWRSTDGGASFTAVVDQSPTSPVLYNGNPLFPHPTDPDVLYFTFGSFFQGYGTDVYRYDHATGNVTTTHNDAHGVDAIEFAPDDPELMYFGLTHEDVQ
jgi:photosystem II stability/assembly factor-like uncharacterized protein